MICEKTCPKTKAMYTDQEAFTQIIKKKISQGSTSATSITDDGIEW